jgi:hypothetical protein
MSWNRFFNDVGRPLLGAIEHAQRARNLVHRDLNPRNRAGSGNLDSGISGVSA